MKNGVCFLGLTALRRNDEWKAVIASEAKQSTVRADSHGLLRPTTTVGVCGKQSRSDCGANSYGKP